MRKWGLILLRELVPLPCWMLYQESQGLLTLQIPRCFLVCFPIQNCYFTLPLYLQYHTSVFFCLNWYNIISVFTSVARESYSEELPGVCRHGTCVTPQLYGKNYLMFYKYIKIEMQQKKCCYSFFSYIYEMILTWGDHPPTHSFSQNDRNTTQNHLWFILPGQAWGEPPTKIAWRTCDQA